MTTPTLLEKKGLLKFLEAFATVNWVFLRILELYLCANIKSLIIGCTYSLLPPDYFFNIFSSRCIFKRWNNYANNSIGKQCAFTSRNALSNVLSNGKMRKSGRHVVQIRKYQECSRTYLSTAASSTVL